MSDRMGYLSNYADYPYIVMPAFFSANEHILQQTLEL